MILITGYTNISKQDVEGHGVTTVLHKPIMKEELIGAVSEILGSCEI